MTASALWRADRSAISAAQPLQVHSKSPPCQTWPSLQHSLSLRPLPPHVTRDPRLRPNSRSSLTLFTIRTQSHPALWCRQQRYCFVRVLLPRRRSQLISSELGLPSQTQHLQAQYASEHKLEEPKLMRMKGFYNPASEQFIEPKHTGISYSFSADGHFEEAYYRAVANRTSISARYRQEERNLDKCANAA